MTSVYYTRYLLDNKENLITSYDLTTIDITCLWDNIVDNNFIEKTEKYTKCPAAVRELKNTFVIKSDFDFKITYQNNTVNITSDTLTDNDLKELFYLPTPNTIMYNTFIQFFTKENIEMTILPAYMHNLDKEYYNLSATYNIGKWFRPLHSTLYNPNFKEINIRRGDPLYYVKFNTTSNIKLIPYDINTEILKYSKNCTNYKKIVKNRSLNTLYNLFTKRLYDKKIYKEIKKALRGVR